MHNIPESALAVNELVKEEQGRFTLHFGAMISHECVSDWSVRRYLVLHFARLIDIKDVKSV
jgi:hypothetical protein